MGERDMILYNKIIDMQKLSAAWGRVKTNHPASGVDEVTWEEYDARLWDELKTLHKELEDHTYTCRPVKIVKLYKNQKVRPVALYCMRDKVVQQSAAEELNKLFEPQFSPNPYSYRKSKSVLQAVGDLENEIIGGEYSWVLKVDIQSFFENIRWEILEKALVKKNK